VNRIKKSIGNELQQAKSDYDFSPQFFIALYVLLFAFLIFQLLLTFPAFASLKPIFWGENGPLENLQFVFFLMGAILSLRMAWFTGIQREKNIVWLFYLAFSLGLFFIAMEEIAWGQQFLRFQTPESIKAFNVQNEFTIHNVELLQDRTDILNLFFGVSGLVGIWLTRTNNIQFLSIPKILNVWFAIIFIMSVAGVYIDFFSISQQIDYSIHKQTETVEMVIAGGAFLFVWFNLRAFTYDRSRWVRIEEVKFTRNKLAVIGDGSKVITIPLNYFLWLNELSHTEKKKFQIGKDGKCILWPSLQKSICIDELLEHKPSNNERIEFEQQGQLSRHFYVSAIAGIVSLVWLLLIPSDPKNVLVFGYSSTRMVLVLVTGALNYLFIKAYKRAIDKPEWHVTLRTRIHRIFVSGYRWSLSFFLSLAGAISFLVILVISFTQQDPYVQGILSRIVPWAFLGLVFSVQLFFYLLMKRIYFNRSKLARATEIKIKGDRIQIVLNDGRVFSAPLAWIPNLVNATQKQREKYELIAEGLQIYWPDLQNEISIQPFLVGIPPIN